MLRTFSYFNAVFLLAPSLFAQASPPAPAAPASAVQSPTSPPSASAATPTKSAPVTTAGEPEATETPAPAPEDPRTTELRAKKERALLGYSLGNVDAAQANLRVLITECDETGRPVCSDPFKAELFVALAIVFAGGKNDIVAATRLFHAALILDPEVMVPRELATSPVQRAMREANRSTQFEELTAPTEPVSESHAPLEKDWGTDEGAPTEEPSPDKAAQPKGKREFVLLHVLGGGGGNEDGASGVLGAGVVIGALPTESPFAIAVRGRAATVQSEFGGENGLVGASVLMGVLPGRANKNMFGYALGGLGLDSYADAVGISAQVMAGGSLGGFLIGIGAEAGGGYGSFGLLSLHMGWGGRI